MARRTSAALTPRAATAAISFQSRASVRSTDTPGASSTNARKTPGSMRHPQLMDTETASSVSCTSLRRSRDDSPTARQTCSTSRALESALAAAGPRQPASSAGACAG